MTDPAVSRASLRGAVDLSGLVRAAQAPSPAPGQAVTTPAAAEGIVRDVDETSFGEVVELSRAVPVIVEFYADGIAPVLGALVSSYGGRLALATVDGNRSPQIAQAFQIQQVPAVVALIGGRPLPLFVGMPSEPEVRTVLDQLFELAEQNGVTGTVPTGAGEHSAAGPGEGEPGAREPGVAEPGAGVPGTAGAGAFQPGAFQPGAFEPGTAAPVEPSLPPLHDEAYDAISAGDYEAAATAYRSAITQNPRDQLAVAGLAQVSLLQRLEIIVAADVQSAAAAAPDGLDAQLAVADLDLSGGHVDDAFARLLRVFPGQAAEGRSAIRTRLLEYFEIVGTDDQRTIAARRALTTLLY